MTHSGPIGALCPCGELAAYQCDWPVDGIVRVPAGELQRGDSLVTTKHAKHYLLPKKMPIPPSGRGKVIEVEVVGRSVKVTAVFGSVKRMAAMMLKADEVYVERRLVGVCRAAVCDAHVRDLGDKHVCSAHWNSWMDKEAA